MAAAIALPAAPEAAPIVAVAPASATTGTTITVSLVDADPSGLGFVDFTVTYDPAVLALTVPDDIVPGSAFDEVSDRFDLLFDAFEVPAGTINVVIVTVFDVASSDPGSLVDIAFAVRPDAPTGSTVVSFAGIAGSVRDVPFATATTITIDTAIAAAPTAALAVVGFAVLLASPALARPRWRGVRPGR